MSINERLQPYIDELDIACPVTFEARENTSPVASMFDVDNNRHHVIFPRFYTENDLESFNPARPFLGNCVHELCHLHLAEKIDPSFAGINVQGEPEKEALFNTAENHVVDIWVNDLFFERFPGLYRQHYENYTKKSEEYIRNRDWFYLLPPISPFTIGRIEGEALRHEYVQVNFCRALERAGFTSKELLSGIHRKVLPYIERDVVTRFGYKSLDRVWDYIREQRGEISPKTMGDIGTIRDYSVTIPRMVYERSNALEMHEKIVNEFSRIGKLPVRAALTDAHPRPIWQLT